MKYLNYQLLMKKRNQFHPITEAKKFFKNLWNLKIAPNNVFENAQNVRLTILPVQNKSNKS